MDSYLKYMDNNDKQGLWHRLWHGEEPTQVRAGSEGSAGGDSPLPAVVPPSRLSTIGVTPKTALSIGVVYRCVEILSNTISALELTVRRNGQVIDINASNRNTLVAQPDVNSTGSAFVQETVWSLALHGNAYWRVYGDGQSLEVLPPDEVFPVKDDNGRVFFNYRNQRLNASQVKHLRLQRIPGELLGVGPIQRAQHEFYTAMRLHEFGSAWFDTSGVPTGVLSTPQTLNAQQAAAFAEAWNQFVKEHGGTVVLGNGMSYEPVLLKPAEAQYLDVRNANDLAIARLFGVPPMHVSVELNGTTNTYTNLEQLNVLFLQNTLSRYMNEIEENLSTLIPRGQRVQFNEDGLLRLDTLTKTTVEEKRIGMGSRTPNEVRAGDGLGPIAGGDVMRPAIQKKDSDNE